MGTDKVVVYVDIFSFKVKICILCGYLSHKMIEFVCLEERVRTYQVGEREKERNREREKERKRDRGREGR